MIAVVNDFYGDVHIVGIFPTYKKARKFLDTRYKNISNPIAFSKYIKHYHWIEFDFGAINFDWDETNEFIK